MSTELKEKVAKIIAEGKLSYLSKLAKDCEASEVEVAKVLPFEACTIASAENFDKIWEGITEWDSCLFVVRHLGSVLELGGKLPKGNYGHGYFNLAHGPEYCVSGHMKVDDITAIAFVSLPETKMPSIAFFDENNNTKFTIYVGYELTDDGIKILDSAKESFFKLKEEFGKAE